MARSDDAQVGVWLMVDGRAIGGVKLRSQRVVGGGKHVSLRAMIVVEWGQV